MNVKRSPPPFTLIHSDIWDQSPIPNIIGARWFVSFIDDCIRTTWIYLLKNKSDVTSVVPIFYNLIKTQFSVVIKRVKSKNAKDYFISNITGALLFQGNVQNNIGGRLS